MTSDVYFLKKDKKILGVYKNLTAARKAAEGIEGADVFAFWVVASRAEVIEYGLPKDFVYVAMDGDIIKDVFLTKSHAQKDFPNNDIRMIEILND